MPAPSGLVQQLDQYLHRRRLLPRSRPILVACSGGADSVALLRLLWAVNQSRYWNWRIVVAHVNHALRGRQSDADERFVRRLAAQLALPIRVKRLRLTRAAKAPDRVSEARARAARIAALAAMAKRHRCDVVVLAHHADDQAETVLLRLLRGAGPRGLGGMLPRRRMRGIWFVRPLLGWPRNTLRQWLTQGGWNWREDSSNATGRFLRNRIRHELLPLLETYQSGIRRILHRTARTQRSVYRVLSRQAEELLRRAAARRSGGALLLDRGAFAAAPQAVAALALRRAIESQGGGGDRIDQSSLIEALRRIRKPAGRRGRQTVAMPFADGILLHLRGQTIRVVRGNAGRPFPAESLRL
ncbi:MAG: tRNA lysidine(34) synthetase TilS, partial [Planctomycetes bacterium]|nr:tRNA lysidine(34) synthetase TilS [Planctomycetota bacterium]